MSTELTVEHNPNEVSKERLVPRILDDHRQMSEYLDLFPTLEYELVNVPRLGLFYIDDIGDVIKDYLRKGIIWESYMKPIIHRHAKPGTTVIDAGAHIGSHTLTMSKAVGPEGRVYAFEPQKKIYRELYHNLKVNTADNVIALRFALGGHADVMEMSPPNPGNEGGTGIFGDGGGDNVELRTIDSFEFNNVSFMKIDVEGAEDMLLDGANRTIQACRPVILIEILGGVDFDTATPEERELIAKSNDKLKALDYEIRRISPHDYLALPT